MDDYYDDGTEFYTFQNSGGSSDRNSSGSNNVQTGVNVFNSLLQGVATGYNTITGRNRPVVRVQQQARPTNWPLIIGVIGVALIVITLLSLGRKGK